MRNLELLLSCSIDGLSALEGCTAASVDYDTGRVYAATRSSNIVCLDPPTEEILWTLSLVEQGYATLDEEGCIVAIQHLPDQQSVCAVTGKGDVLLYNTFSFELECVGSVESGLTSMSWSPDQELVVLSTGASTLLLMTKEFDAITETALHPQEFGEQKPITVGWGRKETQFHGTAGKQAAVAKMEEVKPALAWDDSRVRISWRGDGQFFGVSAIAPDTGVRKLRVWSRDCILQYTSPDVSGLEQALAWKPSGSLLASSQRLESRHDIVFFEKNGLRHGEFTLPFDCAAVQVREILWNTESTIMAVWLEDLVTEEDKQEPRSYIQLWTVCNYHWYLKQSLEFGAASAPAGHSPVAAVVWDPDHAQRLHVVSAAGRYLQYSWCWGTSRSRGTDTSDDACVAVIDGSQVLMTPFRRMLVPPPMCAYSLQLPAPASQVCFAPPPRSDRMAALLSDGRVAVYGPALDPQSSVIDSSIRLVAAGGDGFQAMVTPLSQRGILGIEDESGSPLSQDYPMQFHHLLWVRDQTFVLVSSDPGGAGSTLRHVALLNEDSAAPRLVVESQTTVFGRVYRVSSDATTERVAVQLTDGSVVTPDNEPIVKLPQPCTQMALCRMGGQEVVLGLTERYRFYVDDAELASNCTSFAVHDEFLMMTTHSHTCRCISLQSDPKGVVRGEGESLEESIRRVERGSRIVVVVPGDTRLVLQMPRGNLETVHPRALVLAALGRLLSSLHYRLAFLIMKRHRIDLNLFYDHDPKAFLEHVDQFVLELDSATSLNLFLADLKEEDSTRTLYSAAYRRTPSTPSTSAGSKVNVVCDTVRESIERTNPNKLFLSLLTAHIKKTPAELEVALRRVQALTGEGPTAASDVNDGGEAPPSPDEALRYLILLVEVNDLFDVALGTYDFRLVLMVAEKSQKDPKEYLPFLNKLRSLETHYQRYTIDKHLRRYGKALQHISRCPEPECFAECLSLVTEHKLYAEAMELFDRGSERYKAVCSEYGKYLQGKSRYADAALVLSLSGQWEEALDMYSRCGQWQAAFCMATRLGHTPEQMAQTARGLADYLSGHRRHSEAASILLEYAMDTEEAISVLIEGGQWEEALRLMYKHKREDIIETNLKPAIVERCSSTLASLDSFAATFDRHRARLAAVRADKQRREREELLAGGGGPETDADLYSDTSSLGDGSAAGSVTSRGSSSSSAYSTSTTSSRSSGRSRKNQRKAEQRKRSLREGSKHEDLALLEALTEIMKNVDQLKDDVGRLLPVLVMFDYGKDARALQRALQDTLKALDSGKAEIWTSSMAQTSTAPQGFGPQSTSNAIAASLAVQGFPSALSPSDLALHVPPQLSKSDKWRLHMLDSRSVTS